MKTIDSARLFSPGASQLRLGLSFAIAFALVFGLLGCHGGRSGSSALQVDAIPAPVLRVGTSGDYAPFSLWPEGAAAPRGFSSDLARAFARSQGLELAWVRFRWTGLVAGLGRDFDVALSGVTVRPDRSAAGRFSLPFATSGAVVLVPDSGAASEARSAADLDRPTLRLAVNAGGHLERVARALFPRARIEAVPRNEEVLERLVRGEADAVVSDSVEAPLWRARLAGLRAIGPLTRDSKAALFRTEAGDLARRFDAWLIAAEASGELAALRRRHGLPPERTAEPMAALLASLDERLALMPAVARAKRALGLAVEDRARETRVLEAALRDVGRAAGAGPRPEAEVVRRLFRAQIEAAKWIQTEALARAPAPADAPSPDEARRLLEDSLRPALLRIGDRVAFLVVAVHASPPAAPGDAEVARALGRFDLPPARVRDLAEALRALTRDAGRAGSALRLPPAAAGRAPSA